MLHICMLGRRSTAFFRHRVYFFFPPLYTSVRHDVNALYDPDEINGRLWRYIREERGGVDVDFGRGVRRG